MMFNIKRDILEPSVLASTLVNSSAGALVTFEGWVCKRHNERDVLWLEYECFEALAKKEGEKIIAEACEKFDLVDAVCKHRIGKLPVGELAVWVGVTAAHRSEAFAGCHYIIDEIKLRLPIWKKEYYADGSAEWVNCAKHEEQSRTKETKDTACDSSPNVRTKPHPGEDGGKDDDRSSDFALHWSVLKSRSPRGLLYVDIRSDSERRLDQTTKKALAGRTVLAWPLATIDTESLGLDPAVTYLFFCQRGKRSYLLVKELRKLGHKNVFSLSGGVQSLTTAGKTL